MIYKWECPKCENSVEVHRKMADHAEGPSKAEIKEALPEEHCRHKWHRVYEMPGLTKASFLDGTKRKGFQDLKEIAKLEVKKGSANSEAERKEASKAIADLKRMK